MYLQFKPISYQQSLHLNLTYLKYKPVSKYYIAQQGARHLAKANTTYYRKIPGNTQLSEIKNYTIFGTKPGFVGNLIVLLTIA